jgi:hypothetical protein
MTTSTDARAHSCAPAARSRVRTACRWAAACGAGLALAAGTTHAADLPVEQRVAAEPTGSVAVSNVAGRLQVEGWERPEVHVTGSVGEGVERVEVRREGARTVVKVVLPRGASMRSGVARLLVRVPAASALEVSAVSAEVETRRIGGAQRINAVSGKVVVEGAGGPVEVKTVSGDIVLRGSAQAVALRLTTVSGDVRAEGVGGELEATSVSGDLVLTLGSLRALRVRTTSGDVDLRGTPERGARLEAESVSGDLGFALQAPRGFELDAESFSGDIAACYGARGTPASAFAPGKALRGTRGAGESRLRLKTMSGDIRVCDR